jgi:hypothetical protein
MSFTINYHPKLPHGPKWAIGYPVNSDCREHYKSIVNHIPNGGRGPKDGVRIILRGLPKFNNQRVYVRFWAALEKSKPWDNVAEAYNAHDSNKYENEPPLTYLNGGLVKANKRGETNFRVRLPAGYQSDEGYISPHLHYRVCMNGKMSPVHTHFFNDARTPHHSLMVLRNTDALDQDQQHTQRRLF